MAPKPQEEEVKIDDEEEKEDKEFDPDLIPDVQVIGGITDFSKLNYDGYADIPPEKMIEMVLNFTCFPDEDDVRHEDGHAKGGKVCTDNALVAKLRSIGKEMIKSLGKQLLSGKFNLSKVSFPIRMMIPKTALETAVHGTCLFPLYITKAAYSPDHLDRFKLVIVSTLASFFWTNTFLKPLNPILGETLHATYRDGTEVYCE